MMTFKPKVNSLYESSELSNSEYHALKGWYSSSQMKDAISDIETFHKIYIAKTLVKEISTSLQGAFDTGTYFHTAVLEPDQLEAECHIFDGTRRGKAWEKCKEENAGKVIITAKDAEKAHNLIEACRLNPEMQKILNSGSPEVSGFAELAGLNVKVRADWIDFDKGLIMDLKSTTGNVKDVLAIQKKVDNLDYDLSASFYLDAFNSILAKKGMPLLKEWLWGFASKDAVSSKIYRAKVGSPMLEIGKRKYHKAIEEINKAKENGWKFEDTIDDLEPLFFSKQQWLEEKGDKKTFQSKKTKVSTNDIDLL